MTIDSTQTADLDARAVFDPDVFTAGAPYDALARLRRDSPVHRVELDGLPPMWLLTRHADVITVSRDDATFSSSTGNTFIEVPAGANSAMLPSLDPPRHTQVRRLVNQAFTKRNVARLEDRLRATARSIVDRVVDLGEFDAVPEIAADMSLQVIAEVIGVPLEDRGKIFEWSNAIGSLGIEDPDYAPTPEALGQAGMAMFAYCTALVADRRASAPRDDILSALLAAEIDGERLTDNQLMEFFLLLAVAGNETTRNTLSHGIHALSDHPASARSSPPTPAASRTRSRRCCAGRRRCCTSVVPSPTTPCSPASGSRPVTGWRCTTCRPTATRRCSTPRSGSTSPANQARRSPSVASARTSASARSWPASRSA